MLRSPQLLGSPCEDPRCPGMVCPGRSSHPTPPFSPGCSKPFQGMENPQFPWAGVEPDPHPAGRGDSSSLPSRGVPNRTGIPPGFSDLKPGCVQALAGGQPPSQPAGPAPQQVHIKPNHGIPSPPPSPPWLRRGPARCRDAIPNPGAGNRQQLQLPRQEKSKVRERPSRTFEFA